MLKPKQIQEAKYYRLRKPMAQKQLHQLTKQKPLIHFFSSSFTDERLDDIPNNPDEPFLGKYLNSFVITPKLVQEKIQELNSGKTPGPDGWPPVFLKNVSDLITVPVNLISKNPCVTASFLHSG